MANWEYPSVIISNLIDALEDEFPEIKNSAILRNPNIQTRLLNVLEALDLRYSRKQSMVIDRMQTAAGTGVYGPHDPGTPLGDFLTDLRQVYSKPFLDNFDEDGNYIGG